MIIYRVMRSIFLLVMTLFSVISCKNDLSKEQILEIANRKAVTEGFNLQDLDVKYDEHNKIWSEESKMFRSTSDKSPLEQLSRLETRNYQAIYYKPKELMLGGTLWVFVDRETGEVITFLGGE